MYNILFILCYIGIQRKNDDFLLIFTFINLFPGFSKEDFDVFVDKSVYYLLHVGIIAFVFEICSAVIRFTF